MSEYYHDFLSSMTAAGAAQATTPDEYQATMFSGPSAALHASATPTQHASANYFPGLQDQGLANPSKAHKSRRKSNAGLGSDLNAVKHRRTRSGCFMCRSRRVKVKLVEVQVFDIH